MVFDVLLEVLLLIEFVFLIDGHTCTRGYCEIIAKKNVIHQQLNSMNNIAYVGEKKYSVETFVRAFEYFALSRATYNRLPRDFQLPSINRLTRITSKVKNTDDNSHIHKVFSNLTDDRQKTCVLLFDEVYVKAMLLYYGGLVFGHAVNKPSLLANTVLSFMVVTLFGRPNSFMHDVAFTTS